LPELRFARHAHIRHDLLGPEAHHDHDGGGASTDRRLAGALGEVAFQPEVVGILAQLFVVGSAPEAKGWKPMKASLARINRSRRVCGDGDLVDFQLGQRNSVKEAEEVLIDLRRLVAMAQEHGTKRLAWRLTYIADHPAPFACPSFSALRIDWMEMPSFAA
jgi:hypothetical protein